VAALVRAKYPELSAHQVINRIVQTSHNPPGGIDARVGAGVVDPVAALTFNVPAGDRLASNAGTRVLAPPPIPPRPDRRATGVAAAFAGVIVGVVLLVGIVSRARRAR
jgi:membrane-anchored mycosin MYCP